jgi:chromosome segregation ATPase
LAGVGDDTLHELASALAFCHHTTRLGMQRECADRLAATERDRDEAMARVRQLESGASQPLRQAENITHDTSGSVPLVGCQHQECTHLRREMDAVRQQRQEVERLGRDARDQFAAAEEERDLLRDELHKAQREHEATSGLLRAAKLEVEELRAALDAVTSERDAQKAKSAEAESQRSSCCGTPESIAAANQRIDVITRHVDSLGNTVDAATKENDRLREELASVTAERDALKASKPSVDVETLAELFHAIGAATFRDRTMMPLWGKLPYQERGAIRAGVRAVLAHLGFTPTAPQAGEVAPHCSAPTR